jgi:DnaA regulatory inactivator Hda
MAQILLPFGNSRRLTLDNFVRHPGVDEALSVCLAAYDRKDGPLCPVFFRGPPGSGKTHILRGMLHSLETGLSAALHKAVYIGPGADRSVLEALTETASLISRSAVAHAVAVDDVERLGDEETAGLWTLFNQLTRSGAPLLLASRLTPDEAFKENPHLTSRVRAGLVLELRVPDDEARLLIMGRIAREKNLRVPEEVLRYLLARRSRNLAEMGRVMDLLDSQSLVAKRPVTIPFVKSLENSGMIP